eukprot:CCRYP_009259-RA/>CCRYP_009259-RA protein AED:0.00 eAED:0.00 QI:82/1/1/1/0/0/2/1420/900
MATTTAEIESQLSQAKAHLAKLQGKQQGRTRDELPVPEDSTELLDVESSASAAALQLYRRAKLAQDQLECVELKRSLLDVLQSANLDGKPAHNSAQEISLATTTCSHLGILLLRYQHRLEGAESSAQIAALQDWYARLHGVTRQSALHLFRSKIHQASFPDEEGCRTLQCVLSVGLDGDKAVGDVDDQLHLRMNQPQIREWTEISRCLIELQIVHDALQVSYQKIQPEQPHTPTTFLLPPSWRFDIIDELCRPIANRLRYHFLEDQTAILSGAAKSENSHDSSHIERLPEWLFRYLREITDKGVYSLILKGLQPLICRIMESLLQVLPVEYAMDEGDQSQRRHEEHYSNSHCPSPTSPRQTFHHLHKQYHSHSSSYYLREIVRMARHALRSKSFFAHPDVVGRDCRNGLIIKRGIEQLFLFDDYVREKQTEESSEAATGDVKPPRLVDIFLSSNRGLFQWWLEEECHGAITILRECASSSLSSFQSLQEKVPDSDAVDTNFKHVSVSPHSKQQPPLFPSVSELFVALIHSSRIKSNAFSDVHPQKLYLSDVIGPLCSEYLDLVHGEASMLRKQLMARSKSGSGIPMDNELNANVREWIGIINGTHIASAILNSCHRNGVKEEMLERVGLSMERMRDAMVDDFVSTFIETVVMERAKFASYTMRSPFLLSQPNLDHLQDPRRGQRDARDNNGGIPSSLHLSTDLNDSYHVLSIAVRACHASLSAAKNIMSSQGNDNGISEMLTFGALIIEDALSKSISQKLLDIAIDPQGMTPEIHLAGAQQFRYDAMSIASLFSSTPATHDGTGPLDRVAAASRLMSLSSTQLQQLKQILFDLSSSSNRRSMFGGGTTDAETDSRQRCRLDADIFYGDERLMVEAENMLAAKGFHALALEEALSIINRRV